MIDLCSLISHIAILCRDASKGGNDASLKIAEGLFFISILHFLQNIVEWLSVSCKKKATEIKMKKYCYKIDNDWR